jgi:hypothetical protein
MEYKMKTLLITLLLSVSAFAGLPTKLEELQLKRDKAIENVNTIYKQELQKLLNDPVVKADPVETAKIQSELGINVLPPQNTVTLPNVVDFRDIERRFINKAWKTPFGTTFHFEKDGQGWKTTGGDRTAFTWKMLPDGVVEYAGRVTSASDIKIEYFNFVSKKEAYNGKDKGNMAIPLSLVD